MRRERQRDKDSGDEEYVLPLHASKNNSMYFKYK